MSICSPTIMLLDTGGLQTTHMNEGADELIGYRLSERKCPASPDEPRAFFHIVPR